VYRHATLDCGETLDRPFSSRTAVFVLIREVGKVALVEAPVSFARRSQRLGHQGVRAGLFALQNFVACEVTAIGQNSQLLTGLQ
jgi:hypothetical protein